VASLVAGVKSIAHLEEYPRLLERSIPTDLWAELKSLELVPANAPTPG
jgi:hypothetical protein